MCVFLLVLVLFWAMTRANSGHHLPSLGSQNCSSSLGATIPNISLQTYFYGQHSIQPVNSLAIVWGRVQQTKISKEEEEVKQKYFKFWRGEKKGKAWD